MTPVHFVCPQSLSSTLTRVEIFGIDASASLWETRKEYIKLWWRPEETRGFVWLDKDAQPERSEEETLGLLPLGISSDISHFKYTHTYGHHSDIRISRIVSNKTFKLGIPDVRWFVMGDDDAMFVPENLVRVLSKYDQRQILLAVHPVGPLVSLHHFEIVEPIFPNLRKLHALQQLFNPINLDFAVMLQQSICYDDNREWSISVSWGYAVQIFMGIISPRELEMPSRTFLSWYRRAVLTGYSFNFIPITRHPCQKPFVFYRKNVIYDCPERNNTISNYTKYEVPPPKCRWRMASPDTIQ
ncbi:hypothetical protein SUGI_0121700 [Cryptomeria japonica]|nr:hypothetical protein SUGI_0121700 [Cryptomeria japonica]